MGHELDRKDNNNNYNDGDDNSNLPASQAVKRVTAPSHSIDATTLTALLDRIPSEPEHRRIRSYSPRSFCSSTEPPSEDDDHGYEIKRHQALLDDNCRPLFSVDLLPQIEADPDAHTGLLRPWSIQQHPADLKGKWQALSRQWNRWKKFRAWQLHGRRRRPGFGEYLDVYRRDWFMNGGTARSAARPGFKQRARRQWEREYDYGDEDGEAEGAALERHVECVKTWLAHQGFIPRRPFGLLADPKRQDQWTTYVEYLAFEAESLYGLDRAARRLQKKAKAPVYERSYRAAKAATDQQQFRVGWILSEIDKIEAEQKAVAAGESNGSSTGDSNSGRDGKRRRTDDITDSTEDTAEPRLRKRGRTETAGESENIETDMGDNSLQRRQSKRRRCSADDGEVEENAPGPRLERTKLASPTDDDSSSSIPQPQASGPEALALLTGINSTTTSPLPATPRRRQPKGMTAPRETVAAPAAPDPREERLKTLRPRVNREVPAASTTSRRHRTARRSRGGPRADVATGRIS